MLSLLCDIESSFKTFFSQLTSALGFSGLLAIALAVEVFFIFLFVLKTAFSYEARLKRGIDKLNNWIFKHKKIDQTNIKEFNDLVKKCPKRVVYYWQQYILFREAEPTYYMSLENLVEKPLKTSSWASNIKNLNLITIIWTSISFLFGMAYQANTTGALTTASFTLSLVLPIFVLLLGFISSIALKGRRVLNLDDIYHNYHIFARFLTNACVDLPSYIDYDLLFTPKEIEKGNPQLREFYESRARKAKEEFENAKKNDIEYVEYNFSDAGVDGSLVLERAMKETEAFINKKTSTLAKIAHVDAQKEALKRNYENVQKDLQRKIQASKENINKLIAQQEATTNRMEVGFLRKQQEQEIAKQEQLQQEYDQEETRFAISSEELHNETEALRKSLEESKENVQKAMVSEYQSFYEKIMKSAYSQAEKMVIEEKEQLKKQCETTEKELTIVQTQIKRLVDENNTLRTRLDGNAGEQQEPANTEGKYDEQGNYVYEDGSFHDVNGLFHDKEGNVYDMNGTLISEPNHNEDDKDKNGIADEDEVNDELAFGAAIIDKIINDEPAFEEKVQEEPALKNEQKTTPVVKKRGRPRKERSEESEVKEPKKRGRPKKQVEPIVKEKRPVGRPKKAVDKKTTKRNPYKKENRNEGEVSIDKLNKLIGQEEDKLDKMKMIISSQIDSAMDEEDYKSEINSEKDEILKAVEELKAKADSAKNSTASQEELASINSRLESLIKELSKLNNK